MAERPEVHGFIGTEQRSAFVEAIRSYYESHGRRDMPWRQTHEPYHILVSEIMLQQTQVSRVIPRFHEFLTLFPDVYALASAPLRDVIASWSGLGYNRRARFLHETARRVVDEYRGRIPEDVGVLRTFPGIGVNTAGSISCFAYNTPVVFIETNIRRSMIYHFFSENDRSAEAEPGLWPRDLVAEDPGKIWFQPRTPIGRVDDKSLLPLVEATLDYKDPRTWYYALMDYGNALVRYMPNPNRASRQYVRQSRFEGSRRQVRGRVVRILSEVQSASVEVLSDGTGVESEQLRSVLEDLKREGLVTVTDSAWRISD
ncbi:MAG: A/G-specific adenine glycosylase [Spirochaetaceae bacterium]